MRFINILATCVLGTSAKQIFLGVPPFDTVDETLSIDYGTVSVSPPGRVLPLNSKLVRLHTVNVGFFMSDAISFSSNYLQCGEGEEMP